MRPEPYRTSLLGPALRLARRMALAGLLLTTGCVRHEHESIVFPEENNGWRASGAGECYSPETLFDYINGGAEVYRALNVREVLVQRYAKAGEADLVAEVYDMGSPADAFGAYHHDVRQGESADIGQESEYVSGSLSFWKNRFFVSVVVFEESPKGREAVLNIGRILAATISREGMPPPVVALLPKAGLIPSQLHYFHTSLSLTAHFFLANENVLGLNERTECVLAKYAGERAPSTVLLVRYPSGEAAEQAGERFREVCMPGAGAQDVVQRENGQWMGSVVEQCFFVGVFTAASEEQAQRVLGNVGDRLREKHG